jgi:predicted glycoside hydrolase/deacetylase ChbG (UPF0249 family)
MKRIIFNADDYGWTPSISRGIREAHLNGVVTSTTCVMNMPRIGYDIALAVQETPRLGLGVHLVLTMGRPILPAEAVPSLVDETGNHFKQDIFIQILPRLEITEVKAEWRAQIEAFIRAAGRKPDHLDSHHHSSFFTPELFRAMLEIAREYNCPIRNPIASGHKSIVSLPGVVDFLSQRAPRQMDEFHVRSTDTVCVDFYDDGATHENLLDIISRLENGTTEIMCHPGYTGETVVRESAYTFQRERELKILTDPAVTQAIQANGIELTTFAHL